MSGDSNRKLRIRRSHMIGFIILLQAIILVWAINSLNANTFYLYAFFEVISILSVIKIIYRNTNPSYKLAWITAILVFPGFGVVFYIILGRLVLPPGKKKKIIKIVEAAKEYQKQDQDVADNICRLDPAYGRISSYILNVTGRPVYRETSSKLLPSGEEKLEVLLDELKKAKKFIFLEYFIISDGEMWESVEKILEKKVAEGVEVRLLYDDVGSMDVLPHAFKSRMKAKGIKVGAFNPMLPIINGVINFRDHRKIVVIDGETGFTGGINIGDEYTNVRERFGHWKDTHIMLKGEAVRSLSIIFLDNWIFTTGESLDVRKYIPQVTAPDDGYIQIFEDGPLDRENTSENVYLQIINSAKRYVYITTPYLILDNEMLTALCVTAKSGVDVRIITPAIPDKWYVHMVSRSFYDVLIRNGVRIYEYTPGFIHGKIMVSDDKIGTVGTVNMDYRSFYMHYECSACLYNSSTIADIKSDFMSCMEISEQIDYKKYKKRPWYTRQLEMLLRIFAPMM